MSYPNIAPPCLDTIPIELRSVNQWVNWRLEPRAGETKQTKVPYTPRNGDKASAGKPETWDSFAEAVAAYEASQSWPKPYSGIGFELAVDDGLFGGDIDGCIDPATGEISKQASEIIAQVQTYTESSPSGTGLASLDSAHCPQAGAKRVRWNYMTKAVF